MQNKFHSLQILRAVAAWLVVYHHFMQLYFQFNAETFVGKLFANYGNFGVDIFFVISGFVMYFSAKKDNQNCKNFLQNRILRIVPIYWFYTAIIMIFIYWFPIEFSYTTFDLTSLAASMFFIPHQNPSGIGVFPLLTVGWTLNFEMFFYVALALSIFINKRFAIAICFVVLAALPVFFPKGYFYSEIASSKLLYEFLAGLMLAYIYSNKLASVFVINNRFILILSFSLLAFVLAFYLREIYIFKLPLAVSVVFLSLLIEPYINMQSKITAVLVRLGDESFSTYLVHPIIIGFYLHYTGNMLGYIEIISIIVGIFVTTKVASSLSYNYIEKAFIISINKLKIKPVI